MKIVINTYIDGRLKKSNNYCSGLVFELEDGTFIVHAQDGMVGPLVDPMSKDEYEAWIAKNEIKP